MRKNLINLSIITLAITNSLSYVKAVAINNTLVNEALYNSVQYNQKNLLWGCFLILLFLFWMFILSKIPKYTISRENYTQSLTNIFLHAMVWSWFIFIFWLFGSSLFVSRADTFIQDKLYLIGIAKMISLILLLFIGILNGIKYFYKLSGAKEMFEEFGYELTNGEGNEK